MYIQDLYLDQAEVLLKGEQVVPTGRRDHLHIFCVAEDGQDVEVEILLARRQVQLCTCDCLEDESRACRHIAAALKYLHQHLPVRRKVRKPSPLRESKQLNSKALLLALDQDELKNFIGNYLSLDEGFSIAFKTHFAHKVQLAEGYDIEKYYVLIRRFWRSSFSGGRGRLKIRQLEKYLSSLTGLAQDLQAKKDIHESFIILFGIQRFLVTTQLDYELIHEFTVNLASRIEFLLRGDYAPSLRRKHLSHLLDLISEYEYEIHDNRKNIYYILHSLGEKKVRSQVVQSLTKTQYDKKDLQQFLTLTRILANTNQHTELKSVLASVSHRIHFIEPFFSLLQKEDAADLVLELAEEIYIQNRSRTIRKYLYQLVDSLSIDASHKEFWHIRSFKKNQNPLALLRLHERPTKKWNKTREQLIAHFHQAENAEALAMIYVADGQHSALLDLLNKEESVDLLLNYAEHLAPEFDTEIYQLIEKLLFRYLDSHVGYPSAERINNFLVGLNNTRLQRFTWPLTQALLERYKERKLLVTTLAEVPV